MIAAAAPTRDPLRELPHGPEFRFLDEILEMVGGRRGVATYQVKGDEPFLRGHFPGQPLFPGVLLIEIAAQLAGVTAQSDPGVPPLSGLKLTALRTVKILGTARPGETILAHATILGRMGNLIQAEATAEVAGRRILEATLTLSGEKV
jgi:3-hydroxyacyl-[acyl-carrier-protein] dehydratase